jgi:hypothetical protein
VASVGTQFFLSHTRRIRIASGSNHLGADFSDPGFCDLGITFGMV